MLNKPLSKPLKDHQNNLRLTSLKGLSHQLVRASELVASSEIRDTHSQANTWGPLDLTGRLCELCAAPRQVHLTLSCAIVREFQLAGETTAWVTTSHDTFFPPDLARIGVDLMALPVVQVPDLCAAVTAAEFLTRSSAFGLVLMEIDAGQIIPATTLGRLSSLARQHETSLLILTTLETEYGSMVSMRGRGERRATLRKDRFRCHIEVIKDRRHAPGRSLDAIYRAPYSMY